MDNFYAIRRNTSNESTQLELDYDLDDVIDPFLVERKEGVDESWLLKFQYHIKGHLIEDLIDNGVGWYILSKKVISIIKSSCRNVCDLNIIPFPTAITRHIPLLERYYILGITGVYACLDTQKTKARWSETNPNFAESIFEGYIISQKVPENADIFRLSEYPVHPVVRESIKNKLRNAYVTGLAFQEFKAV